MSFWQQPVVIGLIVGIPSAAIGWLGYRRARQVDRIAEQAGITTTQVTSIGQVVDGLNKIIVALQKDNADLRTDIASLKARISELERLLVLRQQDT